MKEFLSLSYWFALKPSILTGQKYLAAILVIMALLAVAAFIFRKLKKTPFNLYVASIYNFGLYNAIIGTALLFFRYESLPLLSSRFWLIIWILVDGWWMYYLTKKWHRISDDIKKIVEDKEYQKYIP
jgi:hypothetical protein